MMGKQLILSLLSILPLVSAGSTSFKYNNDFSCGRGPVSLSVSSLSCGDDSNVCEFGDRVSITGTATVNEDVSSDLCMSVEACFMGMRWFCESFEESVNLCDQLNMESDTYTCPEQGDYSFETDLKLPNVKTKYLGSGWWVTVYADVQTCDGGGSSMTCHTSFTAAGGSSSGTAASMVGLVALVSAGLYARKRRKGRIDLAREEEQAGHFEMMVDSGVRV